MAQVMGFAATMVTKPSGAITVSPIPMIISTKGYLNYQVTSKVLVSGSTYTLIKNAVYFKSPNYYITHAAALSSTIIDANNIATGELIKLESFDPTKFEQTGVSQLYQALWTPLVVVKDVTQAPFTVDITSCYALAGTGTLSLTGLKVWKATTNDPLTATKLQPTAPLSTMITT